MLAESITAAKADRATRTLLPLLSRNFALGIELLPEALELPVRLGYLLRRIADTIEDDLALDAERKAQLFERFIACFDDPQQASAYSWTSLELAADDEYRSLVWRAGDVFALYRLLDYETREILRRWLIEMVTGMRSFALIYPGGVRITNPAEFQTYCYYVAGTFGHLLTELWRAHSAVEDGAYARLLEDCEAFGTALQTVNVFKGAARETKRAVLEPLIEVVKSDIERSLLYVENLPQDELRLRLFCTLPLLFTAAAVREVERWGALPLFGESVTISRAEARHFILASTASTLTNTSLRRLVTTVLRPG